jgi:hypothetical protein
VITVKKPSALNDYGTWLSLDNGTTWYPIVCSNTSRLPDWFSNNYSITLRFDAVGTCSVYGSIDTTNHVMAATNARSTITGVWRLWTMYDTGAPYGIRVYRQTSGYNGDYPLLVSRTAASGIGTAGTNSSYTNNIYGVIWNDTTKMPTLNPSTGEIKAVKFTGTFNGNASTATSWANARKVYVALGTASKTTTINGGASDAAAIALGIDGTLAIGHGGTGANSANGALVNLFTADTVGAATGDFTDGTIMITSNNSGSTDNWYRRTGIKMWNYIKSKADSVYAGIDALSVANALVYKGVIAGATTADNNDYGALTPAADCGDTYKVSVAGFINGLRVEVGDMLICTTDNTPAATESGDNIYSTIRNNWNII